MKTRWQPRRERGGHTPTPGAEPTAPLPVAALQSGPSEPSPENDDAADGSAVLVVKRGPNAGARLPLKRPVTKIGRAPDSDVFLEDLTASRRHAELRTESDGFRIVDLKSLNGTYVNHQPIESVALHDGDEVQMGKYEFVYLQGRCAD